MSILRASFDVPPIDKWLGFGSITANALAAITLEEVHLIIVLLLTAAVMIPRAMINWMQWSRERKEENEKDG